MSDYHQRFRERFALLKKLGIFDATFQSILAFIDEVMAERDRQHGKNLIEMGEKLLASERAALMGKVEGMKRVRDRDNDEEWRRWEYYNQALDDILSYLRADNQTEV